MVTRYQKRISGPLLDRIDIHVEVPYIDIEKLGDDPLRELPAASRPAWKPPASGYHQVLISPVRSPILTVSRTFLRCIWRKRCSIDRKQGCEKQNILSGR